MLLVVRQNMTVRLIAVGMGEAPIAINQAIQYIEPDGKNRPVHSTSLIEE